MKTYNPNKMLTIEIDCNDLSNTNGYTVWRVINGERKHTLSRNADGKDFDWMSENENRSFERGKYRFRISAKDAATYFKYIY